MADTEPAGFDALVIERIPAEVALALIEIPDLIDLDARPEARSALFPEPYGDEERNAEWRRMVHPELEHLFASARSTVKRDLESLQSTLEDPLGSRLVIPVVHRHAWVSALQQCLQILRNEHEFTSAEIEGLTAGEMAAGEMAAGEMAAGEMVAERRDALLRVHTFYAFQSLLIDEEAAGDLPPTAS